MEGAPLTGQQILEADDLEMERVDCPEWNGFVYIRSIDGTQRDEFEQRMLDSKGKPKGIVANIRAGLIAISACNESGELVFNTDQVIALGKKNAKVLDRLFGVAQRISGLTAEDVEELVKNSKGARADDSTTH